jgi:hypothetical protein
MSMPFTSDRFPAAMAFARREAYRLRRTSYVLLDTVRACLYVLTGPHDEFLEGRQVVMSITADGQEVLGE